MATATAPEMQVELYSNQCVPSAETDKKDMKTFTMGPNGPDAASTIFVFSPTENITSPVECREFQSRFERLFNSARDLLFDDGMETDFSKRLQELVRSCGPLSKDILARLLEDPTVSTEVLAEALRWLGRMEDESTRPARLWLLERALTAEDPSIRDGAVLGLASLDDPSAIRDLTRAAQREVMPSLQRDIEQVLDQLQNRA
jgi:hypothetical protein